MKLITIAGPPSSGKTSVILELIKSLREDGRTAGAVKFDCLTSFDQARYEEAGVPIQVGLAGKFCPDHFLATNIENCLAWGSEMGFDYLITESAGLCNRCSPHLNGVLSVCVIDNLAGVHTPRKIGPMLKLADIIVVTKGDIVSQAEREIFRYNILQANAKATVIFVNGITGQGAFLLKKYLEEAPDITSLKGVRLRFTTPAAVCSYCTGETRIGTMYQMGMQKRMEFR